MTINIFIICMFVLATTSTSGETNSGAPHGPCAAFPSYGHIQEVQEGNIPPEGSEAGVVGETLQ